MIDSLPHHHHIWCSLYPFFQFVAEKREERKYEMDNLQVILEEGKFTDHNYELMQLALEYCNTYLIGKNGKLFLTVDSLIPQNNIITDSTNLFLRDANVKPAGLVKMCLDKTIIEPALYQLVDEFNERKVTHNFVIFFQIDTSFQRWKWKNIQNFVYINNFLYFNFYMNNCKQIDSNWMINFLSGQDAIYFEVETNCLIVFDFQFHTISYLFERANCIINNGNILTDGSDERKKLKRWRKHEM